MPNTGYQRQGDTGSPHNIPSDPLIRTKCTWGESLKISLHDWWATRLIRTRCHSLVRHKKSTIQMWQLKLTDLDKGQTIIIHNVQRQKYVPLSSQRHIHLNLLLQIAAVTSIIIISSSSHASPLAEPGDCCFTEVRSSLTFTIFTTICLVSPLHWWFVSVLRWSTVTLRTCSTSHCLIRLARNGDGPFHPHVTHWNAKIRIRPFRPRFATCY